MSSVLAQILERKRADVARRKAALPLARLQWRVAPTTRHFAAALRRPGPRFILEVKRASPSAGRLREDFDPVAIADAYADVADAISVLTDEPFFQGSFAHLAAVRARVGQPILCKDFVFEPWQVLEARAAGADAVLLMLSVLDDAAWRECAAAAAALGMDALTEVHDEAELDRALALGAPIIGINNRDLRTLRVDTAITTRLAPRIPRDRTIVCESGIASRADVAALAGSVDAFLVGGHLMKALRIDLAARALVHGRVKVCGLTTPDDARLAWRAGASLGGVIFAQDSPRRVDEAIAAGIAAGSPLPLVGVFVDEDTRRIAALARRLALHAVQLHGDETPDAIGALRASLPCGCEIWKALHPHGRIPSPHSLGADRLVLDGPRGGSGAAFDWDLLGGCDERERIIVAGGLSAANARAAQALGCHALDVNSGVESTAGVKDEAKLGGFFAALRGAS
ncbi:MAG TPA: bifunctional indole-3-glycerol-phosphate synthase TrpC/phosphoribosylanthranilate isomerase TrpF [Rhodanobacteraceae bacterium]|nr:bifunctional indole-3-glycerol-phosphate synthase TrpC/phosphoribosylanthranilate isomerase TrpF [Rhodanobacteraceae bacterium]